eukprot:3573100-Rhodomonas_salina.1
MLEEVIRVEDCRVLVPELRRKVRPQPEEPRPDCEHGGGRPWARTWRRKEREDSLQTVWIRNVSSCFCFRSVWQEVDGSGSARAQVQDE